MESMWQAAERLTRNIGTLKKVYEYCYQDSTLAFCNLRLVAADNRKSFRMMSEIDGVFVLRRPEKPEEGWPLYGLASLPSGGSVFVVEGEKDVDSLYTLGLPAVTSGSSSSAENADWSPLAGRDVILWPDNDEPGRRYMDKVSAKVQAIGCTVERINVDALGLPEHGDPSDWLAQHSEACAEEVLKLKRVREEADASGLDSCERVAELVRGDSIVPVPVDWLWDGWLAAGKLHLLGGQPSTGKTTIALNLAATITRGGCWPDGTQAPCGDVVIWSGEDDASDTLVPRLVAAGADMKRVFILNGVRQGNDISPFDPARDTEPLRGALAEVKDLRLMLVDPLVSAVKGDSHKNAEVRRGLQPLVDLARDHRCVVLGITHFSKGTGGREPVERITGSLAFGALARVVLVTAKREVEGSAPATRFLARAKSNIGPDGGGFIYEIEQCELPDSPGIVASAVLWGEALEGTARELLADAERQDDDEARDAVSFLREVLADGPLPVKQVKLRATESGFAWRTVQRAMKPAGVDSRRTGFRQPATWQLSNRTTPSSVAPFAPNNLCGATGATGGANERNAGDEDEGSARNSSLPAAGGVPQAELGEDAMYEVGRI